MLTASRAALAAGRRIQSAVIFGGSDFKDQNVRALLSQGVNVAYVALVEGEGVPSLAPPLEEAGEVPSSDPT